MLPLSENNPKSNSLHSLYLHIRNIHRAIAESSVKSFDNRIVELFQKKKDIRQKTGDNTDEITYYPVTIS